MSAATPAPDFATLYQHRLLLERGIRLYLIDCGFLEKQVFNSEVMWSATKGNPDFQWPRPRIMINLVKGASMKRWVVDNDGARRLNGWNAALKITCLTTAEDDIHTAYVAKATAALAFMQNDLCDNLPFLPYHQISECWDEGDSDKLKSEDGYFLTDLNYGLYFGFRPDVWPVAGTTAV